MNETIIRWLGQGIPRDELKFDFILFVYFWGAIISFYFYRVNTNIWIISLKFLLGFPGGSDGKESACNAGGPWVEKIPWRREWRATPVFLPGESHGPRSLVGYGLWGSKETSFCYHILNVLDVLNMLKVQRVKSEKSEDVPTGSSDICYIQRGTLTIIINDS